MVHVMTFTTDELKILREALNTEVCEKYKRTVNFNPSKYDALVDRVDTRLNQEDYQQPIQENIEISGM